MTNLIELFNIDQANQINKARGGFDKFIPNFKVGDTVSVKYKITEGSNTRIQAFIGVVIAKSKSFENYNSTFTVRKISSGVSVERKFTLYSPLIGGIDIVKKGVVRRAKLYYLRGLTGKASRIKEKLDFLN
ncbi:MAG: large subunit ribosomal protein L19 [Rickettsiales bacterium]|jgi:large subunit ribosomal protein L19